MKVFILTYGCTFNKRDSEYMHGLLGDKVVDNLEEADCVIINSCSVKDVTQNKIFSFIRDCDKKIILAGCIPKTVPKEKIPKVDAMIDTNSIHKLPEVLQTFKDAFSDEKENKINVPLVRIEKDIAIVPISEGCLGDCHYCATKIARGKLKSHLIKDIVQEVKKAVEQGCKKIYLTSQDNGCFGLDTGERLHNLLREVCEIEGDFIVRNGMSNSNHVKHFVNELLDVYKHEKMMKFLHIPVQSGSDKVLKEMNRRYTVDEFKEIVKVFREIPDMNIATDIIVGYPTETNEDFSDTVDLIKEIKPEVLNISKFAARPKTEASKMLKLKSEIVKERSVRLSEIFNNF